MQKGTRKKRLREKTGLFNRHRLIELREKEGLTAYQLAIRTGITPRTIYYYEDGTQAPSFDNIKIIADFFKVNMETFANKMVHRKDKSVYCAISY